MTNDSKTQIVVDDPCQHLYDVSKFITICRHPERDKRNPFGFLYCENLQKYGFCPETLQAIGLAKSIAQIVGQITGVELRAWQKIEKLVREQEDTELVRKRLQEQL